MARLSSHGVTLSRYMLIVNRRVQGSQNALGRTGRQTAPPEWLPLTFYLSPLHLA